MRAGAQDYLAKGQIDGELLVRAMRYAIERQRMLSKVRELREQLLDAERARVLTETAGAAAHEINQPLTVIMAMAEILLATTSSGDPRRPNVEMLREAVEKITEILQKMGSARRYVTQPYAMGDEIVDFDAATEEAPHEGSP